MRTECVSCAGLCLLLVCASAAQQDDKIQRISNMHRSSAHGYRTIHAKYTIIQEPQIGVKGDKLPQVIIKCEWWQDGEQVRWTADTEVPESMLTKGKKVDPGAPPRILREVGVVTSTEVKSEKQQRSKEGTWLRDGTIKQHARNETRPHDLWALALFVVRPYPRATLADILVEKDAVKYEGVEMVGKEVCDSLMVKPVVIKGKSGPGFRVLVDARYNYLVRKLEPINPKPNPRFRRESVVRRFVECTPGVFFPSEVESRIYTLGAKKTEQLSQRTRTTFHSVVVNKPIDPKLFSLSFTPGTTIEDHRNRTGYIVGKDGKPVGPVEVLPAGEESTVEPSYHIPDAKWSKLAIAGATATILAMVALLAWLHVRRNRRQSTLPTS